MASPKHSGAKGVSYVEKSERGIVDDEADVLARARHGTTTKWSFAYKRADGGTRMRVGGEATDDEVLMGGVQESTEEQAKRARRHTNGGRDQCTSSSVLRSCVVSCCLQAPDGSFRSILIVDGFFGGHLQLARRGAAGPTERLES